MRLARIGIILAMGSGVLGIDVGESLRAGTITDGSAHAKRHHRHRKHARKRHRRHHRTPPATEM